MEVSSHAIDYHRVDGVVYKVSGFTNLTQDHLDLHGTMQNYFDSKAQLFTPERTERAVITADDKWGEKMLRHAQIQLGTGNAVRLVTEYGMGLAEVPAEFGPLDWAVINVERDGLGHRFTLANGAGDTIPCCTHLPADFNVSNAALAALMVYIGASEEERIILRPALADGTALTPIVPGRMQLISLAPHTIVDFAHNPDGLTRALEAMDRPGGGRVIIVFGATGERDHLKRPLMGEIAAQHADIVIVTDDDPHGEDPAPIQRLLLPGLNELMPKVREHPKSLILLREKWRLLGQLNSQMREMLFLSPVVDMKRRRMLPAPMCNLTTAWRPRKRLSLTTSKFFRIIDACLKKHKEHR